jgi:hypothetical protein
MALVHAIYTYSHVQFTDAEDSPNRSFPANMWSRFQYLIPDS